MSYSLEDQRVVDWWDRVSLSKPIVNHIHKPTPYLGYMRIFIQDVPNNFCYNFLSTLGVECNGNGEILLDRVSAQMYIDIQNNAIEILEE